MPDVKILLVDEHVDSAKALSARLRGLGYTVSTVARSAEDARAVMRARMPDVVLSAITLDTAAFELPSLAPFPPPRPVPVVRLVADGGEGPFTDGLADALVAPFSDRELRAAIELARCRREAEREIRDLEDRFFTQSIDLLCYLDFNGFFKRLNPAWERTLGYTVAELTSRPFVEFVHPDDRARTLAQNRAVREGGQALEFENRYQCKDGSYRWFRWNAASDQQEHVIYSVARDVTAQKEADAERERLVTELQTALDEIRDMERILPICAYCHRVRDDENFWLTVESYFARHTNTQLSHSICPTCMETKVEPEIARLLRKKP